MPPELAVPDTVTGNASPLVLMLLQPQACVDEFHVKAFVAPAQLFVPPKLSSETAVGDAVLPVAFITTVSSACVVNPLNGNPVAFVSVPDCGVPRIGVTSVKFVALSPLGSVVLTVQVPAATCGTPVDAELLRPVPPNCAPTVPLLTSEPAMLLFVSVSVVARPTKVSDASCNVQTRGAVGDRPHIRAARAGKNQFRGHATRACLGLTHGHLLS